MKPIDPTDPIRAQVAHLLKDPGLSDEVRLQGSQILKRLELPVRVVILGLPGSGKSSVLNLFAGERLVPDVPNLPTLEITGGPALKTVVNFPDGMSEVHEELALERISADAAVVRVETPSPAFEGLSLMEVVSDGNAEERAWAIDWAVQRADILLWCTDQFGAEERALWALVPETSKDHAFLVLTRADLLSREGSLAQRMTALKPIAEQEFFGLLPVASDPALGAISQATPDEERLWKASGARALTAEVLRHARSGRRGDLDQAILFLKRHGGQPVEPRPTPPKPVDAPATAKAVGQAARENCDLVLDYIRRRAAELSDMAGREDQGREDDVLAHCVQTVDKLGEMMTGGPIGGALPTRLSDEIGQAAEVMLLMQLERGEGRAADAVTLLLQLRRDMEQAAKT